MRAVGGGVSDPARFHIIYMRIRSDLSHWTLASVSNEGANGLGERFEGAEGSTPS